MTEGNTEGNSVASIIKDQIGSRALLMIGAKNLVDTGKGLSFKVGHGVRNENGRVNYITITLDEATDTYIMEALYGTVRGLTTRAKIEGVYVEMLHDFIRDNTGMALSL